MFTGMFFQKNSKIDAKNRLFLPSESAAEAGKDVIVAKMQSYYQIFMLERINALVDGIQKNYYKVNAKQRAEILRDLNYIFSVALKTSRVDSQRRIVMPSVLEPSSSVVLQGRGTSIAVFPSYEEYKEYMSSIETTSILR